MAFSLILPTKIGEWVAKIIWVLVGVTLSKFSKKSSCHFMCNESSGSSIMKILPSWLLKAR